MSEKKYEYFTYGWYLVNHSDDLQRWHLIDCPYSQLDTILNRLTRVSSDDERGIIKAQQFVTQ